MSPSVGRVGCAVDDLFGPPAGSGARHYDSALRAFSWEASGYDSGGHENTVTTSGAVSLTMRTCSWIGHGGVVVIFGAPLVIENHLDPPTRDLNHATQVVPLREWLREQEGADRSVPGDPSGLPIAGGRPVRQCGAGVRRAGNSSTRPPLSDAFGALQGTLGAIVEVAV